MDGLAPHLRCWNIPIISYITDIIFRCHHSRLEKRGSSHVEDKVDQRCMRWTKSWLLLSMLLLVFLCTYNETPWLKMEVDGISVGHAFESPGRVKHQLPEDSHSKHHRRLREENIYDTKRADNTNSQKRTATGGVIRQVLIFMSAIAFIGNGAFLVFVFWM